MRIYRFGRVLDQTNDSLFPPADGNGITLSRANTDNYVRARTPHVDCTVSDHSPTSYGYDDGTQTNRWVSVPGRLLPAYVANTGWKFEPNRAIRTSYNIPISISEYTARVAIPPPYFPVDVIPRQWCLSQVETDDILGRTISATGIRWGSVFWGVGHYRIRCCPNQLVEESACLVLDVNGNLQYFFPMWGNVSVVDITIRRLSPTLVRVSATAGSNTFTHTFNHTLSWAHPYRAEYYLHQHTQNCTAPEPIQPYYMLSLRSPALVHSYQIDLPIEYLDRHMYLQTKTVPDVFTSPYTDVALELKKDETVETIDYEYNSETNLWEPKYPFTPIADRFWFIVSTNQILERVSVMIGGAVLHYVPAPHQVEWMAVLPVEMEQTGIPDGIIPDGYDILGVADYARVGTDGSIRVLPAQYARVLTIHLREHSV